MPYLLPTQDQLRGNADPLLRVLAAGIVDFRARHLQEGSDYVDAVANGQKPLAIVSQCVDGRQPAHVITGLPPGKLIAQSSIAGFVRDYPDSPAAWAAILFAVKSLGAPVIIKLGHSGCGGAAKLVDMCANDAGGDNALDPMLDWLLSALPLARRVLARNPGASATEAARLLEEELVRDGVAKMEDFIARMIAEGHLPPARKPVVIGLLFEMHTARLYRLEGGAFTLLSQSLNEEPV